MNESLGSVQECSATGEVASIDPGPQRDTQPPVILSFDVEEHHRIEAASGLQGR